MQLKQKAQDVYYLLEQLSRRNTKAKSNVFACIDKQIKYSWRSLMKGCDSLISASSFVSLTIEYQYSESRQQMDALLLRNKYSHFFDQQL